MSERSNAVPNYLRIYRHPGRLNNQVVRTSVNNRDLAWSGKYKVELEVTEEEDNFKKADTIALYFKSRKHAISVLNESHLP